MFILSAASVSRAERTPKGSIGVCEPSGRDKQQTRAQNVKTDWTTWAGGVAKHASIELHTPAMESNAEYVIIGIDLGRKKKCDENIKCQCASQTWIRYEEKQNKRQENELFNVLQTKSAHFNEHYV